MGRYKIVCIDDEKDVLNLFPDLLRDLPYEVITFDKPENAIQYIENNANLITFILSDYSMPMMNGFELREKVLNSVGYIPFALVTGFYSKEMAVKGMELKVSAFVEKPFDSERIKKVIESNISSRIEQLEEEKEMICSFVEESFPMLEEIEELILVLEENPTDTNALNSYFRLLHTIKGTSSCVGLKSVPAYTHKYEDLVGKLKAKELKVNKSIIDVLLMGLDELKKMYSSIQAGEQFEFNIKDKINIFSKDFSIIEESTVVEKEEKIAEIPSEITGKSDEEKISVGVNVLDEFMELSGELTVLRNMILKSAMKLEAKYHGDRDFDTLSESLEEMHKVSSLLQNEISEMRKISLDSVFKPMKRVVRDASKILGKEIDFKTQGEALRVDTLIARVLNGALVHLIRNGIDHGIESPEKREELGKARQGQMQLKAYEEADNIIIEILDDGNGIDPEKLKAKALEKGLYDFEQLEKMSESRVLSMIFESGFSTAAQVTDLSGRGVGMDMVRSSVEEIGGKIHIDSKPNKGSKFVMVLPIPRSVLIMKALMLECNKLNYCIALDEVAEVFSYDPCEDEGRIVFIEKAPLLNTKNELVPLVSLNNVLKLSEEKVEVDLSKEIPIVIVKGEGFKYGIIVDQIHDIEEIVVKKMSSLLKGVKTFAGSTLVGDGDMALILDLVGIANLEHIAIELDAEENIKGFDDQENLQIEREYMQFNLFSRKNLCVELSCVSRLEEIESSKVEYSGDIPLVRYREDFLPLINIERLLNFSGTNLDEIIDDESVLNVIVVNQKERFYGLVVRSINDIGLTTHEVDKDLIDREGILGTVFIDDRTITLLDVNYLVENYVNLDRNEDVMKFEKNLSSAA